MREIKDYYKILQVHHQAEPDVIEGAFKKLVKKYHPDVNPSGGAEQTMKEINTAYQILSDPLKRREYHQKWLARPHESVEASLKFMGHEVKVAKARKVLEDYFQSILTQDFEGAYRLISRSDQANISPGDFGRWQVEVAKVFELKQFRCEAVNVSRNETLRGVLYPEVIEFQTATVEKNVVMERMEKDRFLKKMVSDQGNWQVFLGYEGLQQYIDKFQQLSELITAKSVIQDLLETRGKNDPLTGLLNFRGFMEQAEKEVSRHQRYGNVFSMIRCELIFREVAAKPKKKEPCLKQFAELLTANLRQLDVMARTDECGFTILLPETGLERGIRVAVKIRDLFLTAPKTAPDFQATLNMGVVQINAATLTDTLRQADYFLHLANQGGTNRIASSKGLN